MSKRLSVPTRANRSGKLTQPIHPQPHLPLRSRTTRNPAVPRYRRYLSCCLWPFLRAMRTTLPFSIVSESLPNRRALPFIPALRLRTHLTGNLLRLQHLNQYFVEWENPRTPTLHSNLSRNVSALFWTIARYSPPPPPSRYNAYKCTSKQM
jgi:hypothetical protein